MSVTNQPSIQSLDVISVKTPCQMDWGLMTGDDKIRFCDHCTKNVYNVSGMSRDQAIETINSNEGDMCVRFFRRPDGTIVTADCPPIKNRNTTAGDSRRWFQFSVAGLLVLITATAGLCAAAPWIKEKVQPLVDRLFPAEIEPVLADQIFEEIGDIDISATSSGQQYFHETGELEIVE